MVRRRGHRVAVVCSPSPRARARPARLRLPLTVRHVPLHALRRAAASGRAHRAVPEAPWQAHGCQRAQVRPAGVPRPGCPALRCRAARAARASRAMRGVLHRSASGCCGRGRHTSTRPPRRRGFAGGSLARRYIEGSTPRFTGPRPRRRKKEARAVHEASKVAQSARGIKAKLLHERRCVPGGWPWPGPGGPDMRAGPGPRRRPSPITLTSLSHAWYTGDGAASRRRSP